MICKAWKARPALSRYRVTSPAFKVFAEVLAVSPTDAIVKATMDSGEAFAHVDAYTEKVAPEPHWLDETQYGVSRTGVIHKRMGPNAVYCNSRNSGIYNQRVSVEHVQRIAAAHAERLCEKCFPEGCRAAMAAAAKVAL